MAIFTIVGGAIAGALFGGSTIAAALIAGGLAYGAKYLASQYLGRTKKQKYTAVQGQVQMGGDVPVSAVFGPALTAGQRVGYFKWGSGNAFNADVFALANGWHDGIDPIVYFYGKKHNLVTRPIIANEAAHFGIEGFGTLVSIRFYDGRPTQGPDTKLVADTATLGSTWKTTSVGAGVCYVVVERKYDSGLFDKGRPDFQWVLKGLKEYDPRKDSTVAGGSGPQRINNVSTWVATKNPAVHRLNYQLGLRGLISQRTLVGEGKSIGQLDLATYFVAMNVCDTVRNGKATYECSLFVDGAMDHTEILKEFDDAMAGYGLNRRGLSGIIAGAPQMPVLNLTKDDLPIDRARDVQPRKSAFDRYNYISGQFTSIEAMWKPESLKPVTVNADVAADKRPRQTSNDFLQVTDPDIAQYLLNIRYRQNRKGGTVTVPVSRRVGLKVQEGEWITFGGVTYMISEWSVDDQFRFTLKLTETGADIYDDEDIQPGPIVIPPTPPLNPSLLSTVQNFDVQAGVITNAQGYDVPALIFTWTPPGDPTITAVRFSYQPLGSTDIFNDQCLEPERGTYTTTKNIVSGKAYTAFATITTVPDRLRTNTPVKATPSSTGVLISDVLDNAITASKIADAAIMAAKIADSAVTTAKLANLSVNAGKIADAAVTNAKVADFAISSTKIANLAVTLAKFATGIEPVSIISGSTVPTTKSTENVSVNGKLYTWNTNTSAYETATPGPGSITQTEIADNAITTPKLSANAVNADKIAANAVTSAKIAAGSVTADKIASNAVLAKHILVGDFENLIPNATFQGGLAGWFIAGTGGTWSAYSGTEGRGIRLQKSGTSEISIRQDGYAGADASLYYPVKAGDVLRLKFKLTRKAGTSGGNIGFYSAQLLQNGTIAVRAVGGELSGTPSGSTLQLDVKYTIPSDTVGIMFAFRHASNASSDGSDVVLTDISAERMNAGELIVDGAIVAGMIAAKTISARELVIADFENLIHNATMLNNMAGWTVVGTAGFTPYVGTEGAGVRIVKTATTSESSLHPLTYSSGLQDDFTPVTPGDRLRIKFKVTRKGGASGGNIGLHSMQYRNNGSAPLERPVSGFVSTTPLDTTVELNVVYTVPSDAIGIQFRIYYGSNAASANGDIVITDISVMRMNAAALVVDGGIIAAMLAADSVTANAIAANAVTADKIVTNAISARQLAVADFSNLVYNNWAYSADTQGWSFGTSAIEIVSDTSAEAVAAGVAGSMLQFNGSSSWAMSAGVTVSPGEKYYAEVWVNRSSSPAPAGSSYLQLRLVSGVDGSISYATVEINGTNGSWFKLSGIVTIPANVTAMNIWLRPATAANSGTVKFARPLLRRAASTELIVDGAVIADKIAANAIGANHIAANAITAKHLVLVDFTNLVANGDMQDGTNLTDYWAYTTESGTSGSAAYVEDTANAYFAKRYIRLRKQSASAGQVRIDANNPYYLPVVSGEVLHSEVTIRGNVAASAGFYFRYMWFKSDGTAAGTSQTTVQNNVAIPASWTTLTGKVSVPATAAFAMVRIYNANGNTTAQDLWIGKIVVRKANAASLIVDGGITADKLNVNSLTAVSTNFGNATVSGYIQSVNGKMQLDFNNGNIIINS